jgi:hypothetical protein
MVAILPKQIIYCLPKCRKIGKAAFSLYDYKPAGYGSVRIVLGIKLIYIIKVLSARRERSVDINCEAVHESSGVMKS